MMFSFGLVQASVRYCAYETMSEGDVIPEIGQGGRLSHVHHLAHAQQSWKQEQFRGAAYRVSQGGTRYYT